MKALMLPWILIHIPTILIVILVLGGVKAAEAFQEWRRYRRRSVRCALAAE